MPQPASEFPPAFILTGPTGSGKSALALEMAFRLGAEIISMDSMTVYRGMDIGTAKPSAADRTRVPHHLLDQLDPWECASIAWWLEQAHEAARAIRERGKRILVVGGTPLYLKALLHGLFSAPASDQAKRKVLESRPAEELHERLQSVDPAAAGRIHPHDQKRLVRALEVYETTGKPISDWQTQFKHPAKWPIAPLWLDWPRAQLHERINRRVLEMVQTGWVEEVRQLVALPQPLGREAARAAGYWELAEFLTGRLPFASAIEKTQARTRQLAKRQLTWLRNLPGLIAIPVKLEDTVAELAERCLQRWKQMGAGEDL